MYGPEVNKSGSFARNCLLARRMAERDVRFIQLFHRGWDHHSKLPVNLRGQTKDVDQPIASLLKDLEQRGLLDDTTGVEEAHVSQEDPELNVGRAGQLDPNRTR